MDSGWARTWLGVEEDIYTSMARPSLALAWRSSRNRKAQGGERMRKKRWTTWTRRMRGDDCAR
jgi:hypothetical protein